MSNGVRTLTCLAGLDFCWVTFLLHMYRFGHHFLSADHLYNTFAKKISKGYKESIVLIISLLAFLNGLSISGQNVIDWELFQQI